MSARTNRVIPLRLPVIIYLFIILNIYDILICPKTVKHQAKPWFFILVYSGLHLPCQFFIHHPKLVLPCLLKMKLHVSYKLFIQENKNRYMYVALLFFDVLASEGFDYMAGLT